MFSNKIVIVLVCVFLSAGAIFLGVLSWNELNSRNQAVNTAVPSAPSDSENTADVVKATTEERLDGEIQWLSEPIKLGDLKLVAYSSDGLGVAAEEGAESYYKVANINGGGEIINAFMPPQGPGANLVIRFKKPQKANIF